MPLSNDKKLEEVMGRIADLPLFENIHPLTPNSRNVVGETPLHVAAIWGDVGAIETLIKAGADINASGEHGFRPLHEAVVQGKCEAVKTLLKFGANTTIMNDDGQTPGELAELLKNVDIKRLIK